MPGAAGAPGSLRIQSGAVPVPIFAQPIDGLPQAVFERYARSPAEEPGGLRIVGQQALDLAIRGAYALTLRFDASVLTHEFDEQRGEVANRNLAIRAEIECLSDGRLALRRRDVALDGVGHV